MPSTIAKSSAEDFAFDMLVARHGLEEENRQREKAGKLAPRRAQSR